MSRQIVLIPDIVHTEQQRRQQRDNHDTHYSLGIDRVVDADTAGRGGVRDKKECLKALKHAVKIMDSSSLLKIRAQLVNLFS